MACLGALCINPYGHTLVTSPLTMQQAWIRDLGPEWQSPWHGEGWRLVGGGVFIDLRLIYFGYAAGLAGVVWMALRRWRTVDLVPAAVMVLWLALSLWHLRTVFDMALLTGPLVAAALPAK